MVNWEEVSNGRYGTFKKELNTKVILRQKNYRNIDKYDSYNNTSGTMSKYNKQNQWQITLLQMPNFDKHVI
ncbi:hypothetical protein A994_06146 [Methanobacterium formicicum DSM 3637]|uniref:Uncharacterized protein n=1 Tax=Methanobacterium formicicum (strain DSM 3637 / PP1) TaxID=1204725 RepID=K2RTD2_METFP|nr:hypothetical protein A994_06146 [Methanobacterium formicicum DSM 3637]